MNNFFCKPTLLILYALMITVPVVSSCSKDSSTPEWEWDDSGSGTTADSLIVAQGWTRQTDFGDLPSYIRVYKSPSKMLGKTVIAYIALADTDSATFSVLGSADGYNTPADFYDSKKHSIIMNGGYFWSGSSLSLLCRNSVLLCPNNQVEYRDNDTEIYYPTRGAFGLMDDGSWSVNWVYTNNDVTYSYPSPAENKSGSTPLAMPSATFPEGASEWAGKTAIGGGPVLVKDSTYVNSWEAELFDDESGVDPESSNPRSAIGITGAGKLIFLVCEGREMTTGGVGLTLEEEANIMLSLGCVSALNLDGGGSSCMIVNGKETIQPSDGEERSVVTGVAID